jgi:hypothetical protein
MSHSRIFHSYRDVTNVGERLQNLGVCTALKIVGQGGIFIVPHIPSHKTSFFLTHPKDHPIQPPFTTHKEMWKIYCKTTYFRKREHFARFMRLLGLQYSNLNPHESYAVYTVNHFYIQVFFRLFDDIGTVLQHRNECSHWTVFNCPLLGWDRFQETCNSSGARGSSLICQTRASRTKSWWQSRRRISYFFPWVQVHRCWCWGYVLHYSWFVEIHVLPYPNRKYNRKY